MTGYISKGAVISGCGKYRYRLWREWRNHPAPAKWYMWSEDDGTPIVDGAGHQLGEPLTCVFVMLNPSTADGEQDDPTIRRCVDFAKREGFDRLDVLNLFAWRATDPQELFKVAPLHDPVGWENERHVFRTLDKAGLIICAWGAHGGYIGQDETMLGWIDNLNYNDAPVMSLGITKAGLPRHPLYLPKDAPLVAYSGRSV